METDSEKVMKEWTRKQSDIKAFVDAKIITLADALLMSIMLKDKFDWASPVITKSDISDIFDVQYGRKMTDHEWLIFTQSVWWNMGELDQDLYQTASYSITMAFTQIFKDMPIK